MGPRRGALELWLCTHADPTEPPSLTNPSTWLAQSDFSAVYPFTSCVRVDSVSHVRGKLTLLLRIAKWLRELPFPV